METLSYTQARAELAQTINKVVRDREPVIIKKKNDAVVMISLDDYSAWAETVYLLRSPKNAQRLTDSIKNIENGCAVEKSLESLLNEKY